MGTTQKKLENKAAFFAQYWGQDICNDIGCALSNETFEEVNASTSIEYAFLKLTPLSQISEEDAVLFGFDNKKHFLSVMEEYRPTAIMTDFLRSKGYAVPWRDLSVEDLVAYGWVKLKSE